MQAAAAQDLYIVLKPTLHPELGEIRIEGDLFAIGRNESPFAGYERSLVAEMSRRHARIFIDRGVAYVADLDSRNGTTVNGVRVKQKPQRLRAGDEVCFCGELAYRVELGMHQRVAPATARLLSITLVPERDDLGLQPLVISSFPFLISKGDEVFSRYADAYPHQVNYVSRRHAHIFLKEGAPFVEDLGSTNGTFVDGTRLDEHAVELGEGNVLAFGGRHFVYRVSLQWESASERTLTQMAPAGHELVDAQAEAEKTTFIAAPDSFLDIFCVDAEAKQEDEAPVEVAEAPAGAAREDGPPRRRARWAIFLSELAEAFGRERGKGSRRRWQWAAAAAVVLALAGGGLYLRGAPERELAALMSSGDFARAAALAHRQLTERPEDAALAAQAADALLKARVPEWLTQVQAREFDRALAVVADMRALGAANVEVAPLAAELEWIGNLERFIADRGGPDAPIRIFTDEDRIRALVEYWRRDPRGHQRALARIEAQVPGFGDQYARALSLLRKLESDEAVYLSAIERLKTALEAERGKGDEAALDGVVRDYAERYPRLEGLAALRQRYRALPGSGGGDEGGDTP